MPLYWISFLLPGMDGLAVLEQVRAKRCKTAIMMLTAVDTVPKILQAFDLGADDYLVKPFLLEILLARLTAIARRGQSTPVPPLLPVGDLILDRSRRSVRRAGRSIHLTRKQFGLLELHWRTWFRRDEPRYWRGGTTMRTTVWCAECTIPATSRQVVG